MSLATAPRDALPGWALLCALGALAPACASSAGETRGVPNLRQVEPGVWRGGEPSAAGWQYLRSLGVRTVVKLNFDDEGSDQPAALLGMTVVEAPLPPARASQALEKPDSAQVARGLSVLLDRRRWPIYVHCTHGQDRTGLVVGLFRVVHDHWTKAAAWDEMLRDGFHEELLGLTRFWRSFDGTLPGLAAPSAPAPATQPASRPDLLHGE